MYSIRRWNANKRGGRKRSKSSSIPSIHEQFTTSSNVPLLQKKRDIIELYYAPIGIYRKCRCITDSKDVLQWIKK